MRLFNQCFSRESKNLIIIGDWNKFKLKVGVHDQSLTSLAVLDVNNKKIPSNESKLGIKVFGNHPASTFFKLQSTENFIIAEIDLSSLELAFEQLKNSIWWNVYGFFMIQRIYQNSCDEAYDYLKIAWDFKILNAVYLCMDHEFKIRIHTFNPYSDNAPTFWKKYKSVIQSNAHPLTLFSFHHQTELNSKF